MVSTISLMVRPQARMPPRSNPGRSRRRRSGASARHETSGRVQTQRLMEATMPTMSRQEYVGLFGPTTGDRIRLGDTGLFVELERDLRGGYGDELVFGGGKSMREGMGM